MILFYLFKFYKILKQFSPLCMKNTTFLRNESKDGDKNRVINIIQNYQQGKIVGYKYLNTSK